MAEDLLTIDDDLLEDDLFIKPIKKKKVLMLSDHPLAPSGVGIQSRFLIEGLIKTGKYSFKCLGGAIKHQDYRTIKVNDDFIVKPVDGFGNHDMIRQILVAEQPDVLIIFTDPRQFIWLWEIEDEIHKVCPIAYWHVWDNDPYPAFNKVWYRSTDLISCLSYKTYELVKPHFPEKTSYIPHTFPKNVYFELPKEDKKKMLQQHFGNKADWFKALWVNRNATRKLPADVLDAWKLFLDNLEEKHGNRNAVMVMHTDPKDGEGPDLYQVTERLGLQNNVFFSTEKLQFDAMNMLYNLVDVNINVAKNEGFGLCLGGDTKVITKYGYKNISEIVVGDEVRAGEGNFHKVLATSKRKERKVVKIRPVGQEEILSSFEHPFLVSHPNKNGHCEKTWVTAEELKKGDYLCIPKPVVRSNKNKEIDLLDWAFKDKKDKNLIISDKFIECKMGYSSYVNGLSIKETMNKFNISKHSAECARAVCLGNATTRKFNIKKINDIIKRMEEHGEGKIKFNNKKIKVKRKISLDSKLYNLLGWYLAEGSSSNGKGIEISLHRKEYKVADKIKNIVKTSFNVSGTAEIYKENSSRFYCSSKILSSFFENSCGKHSHNKRLDDKLWPDTDNNKIELLKGILFGDGSFSKSTRQFGFSITSKKLCLQVQDLLHNFNIYTSFLEKKKLINKDVYGIRISGSNYSNLCKLLGVNENKVTTRSKSRNKFDNKYIYTPIQSVTKEKLEKDIELFDLQIKDVSNFVANGVIVHNSTLISMQVGKPVIALKTGGETSKVMDYRDGSEHGVGLDPAKRCLVGSQLVPYIYEDYADTKELADAFMTVHDYTPEEKEAMSKKCKDYVDLEFDYENMIRKWDEKLTECVDNYEKNGASDRWELISIEPHFGLQEPPKEQNKEPDNASKKHKKSVKKSKNKKAKNKNYKKKKNKK